MLDRTAGNAKHNIDHQRWIARLGPFQFGDSGPAVVEGVTATVGGWDADSSDNDANVPPSCDPAMVHVMSWGSLVLMFTTRDGTEAFTGWS
jgi:hypothetical protein